MSNARRLQFVTGLDYVVTDWTGGAFFLMLVKDSWVPDETVDVVVADVAADELTDGSYGRQTVGGKSKSVVLPTVVGGPGYIRYLCSNPTFGVISGGEVATSLVLARLVTTDADSPLVASYPIAYVADGITPAVFNVAGGAIAVATTCP